MADDGAELVAVVEVVGVAVGEVGVVEVAAVVIVGGAESTVVEDVAPACPGGEPPDSSSGRFLMDRNKKRGYLLTTLHNFPHTY